MSIAPRAVFVILAALGLQFTSSAEALSETGLPVPRFVSLRSGEANLRTGPGETYPIDWVYQRKGLPVEIMAEFEHWRKVRDMEGTQGWMHKNLLSGERTVIVTGETRTLRREASSWAVPVAKVEPGTIGELHHCDAERCEIEVAGRRGWLRRTEFWGVYPDERVE